ncbi:RteC domain-containing protein [Mucilaginibacter gynuensis]|uniref:RteC domain-containing protein n=1 Tax=Mucilaginibacter gynuensis TaxID=1302236 RepID=A0ABP8GYL2_9SPHI
MINQFAAQSFPEMKEEIAFFMEMGTLSVKKVSGGLAVVDRYLQKLKDFLAEHPFTDEQQEIRFFKYEKPRFLAERLFILERYTVDSAIPLHDDELTKKYFEQELAFVRRFFHQNRFLYQYHQVDASELDHLYFIRGVDVTGLLINDAKYVDPQFSTACDHLFAQFIAHELLQGYLLNCLKITPNNNSTFSMSKKGRILKWTGDKTNLIELAYGIYNTLQINDGAVDISDIIDWLEQSLQVSLSRYYRRFSEIKARKSVSKTKFLDEMRAAVMKHIDDSEAYKP